MAFWHEVERREGGWLFPARDGERVFTSFRGLDVRKAPFEGRFYRYDGEGAVPKGFSPWKRDPVGWVVLIPREPLRASSIKEAKTLFQPFLSQIEEGSWDERFDIQPYVPPVAPKFIERLKHPTHRAEAVIVERPDGVFEAYYRVYAPNGRYFPVSTPSIASDPDNEWGVTSKYNAEGRALRTLADSAEAAQEIARQELLELVAQDDAILLR